MEIRDIAASIGVIVAIAALAVNFWLFRKKIISDSLGSHFDSQWSTPIETQFKELRESMTELVDAVSKAAEVGDDDSWLAAKLSSQAMFVRHIVPFTRGLQEDLGLVRLRYAGRFPAKNRLRFLQYGQAAQDSIDGIYDAFMALSDSITARAAAEATGKLDLFVYDVNTSHRKVGDFLGAIRFHVITGKTPAQVLGR